MKYNIVMDSKPKTVTVITPTIGSPKVRDAVKSVQDQTYKHIRHLLVVDGEQYDEKFVENFEYEELEKLMPYSIAPENTGGGGFYGHRIYAGYAHLVNTDYIFFLDEDNWYEPNHVETLVEVLNQGNEFAYSLRKIFDPDKNYICDDNCEALGKWPIYFSDDQYLIDTSAFAFRREFLIQTSQLWHHGWGGDRRYYGFVRNVKHDTNGKHTLCYRLDGNQGSVSDKLFIEGNRVMSKRYNNNFPWVKK